MSDNEKYINKIIKGLAVNKIQIVNPDHLVDMDDSDSKNHNNHYIGQRHYITTYSDVYDEKGNLLVGEGKIELIDIDNPKNDRGSIFDKSQTIKIDENTNVVPEKNEKGEPTGKYTHNYIKFQAANVDSGLYKGKFEDDSKPRVEKGSDYKILPKTENKRAPEIVNPKGTNFGKSEITKNTFDQAREVEIDARAGIRETYEDPSKDRSKEGWDYKVVVETKNSKSPNLPAATSLGEIQTTSVDEKGNPIKDNEHIMPNFTFTKGREVEIDVKSVIDNDAPNTVGTTIWDDGNWDNSIKTNVDKQDDKLLDDIEGPGDVSGLGSAIGNSAANLVNQIGVVSDVKKIFAKGEPSYRPEGTAKDADSAFSALEKAKSEKYKNIKMSSKLGTYNSLENLLGGAAGMFVGSLGKSMLSSVVDDMTSKFTGGIGIAGMVENLGGALESMPSADEILALNVANYYNMYTAKPGRIVTDRYRKYNFITHNVADNIDGSKNGGSNVREGVQKVLNTVSKGVNFASNILSGKALADGSVLNSIGKKKGESEWEDLVRTSRIISNKRTNLEVEVGSKMAPAKADERASLGGYTYDVTFDSVTTKMRDYLEHPRSYAYNDSSLKDEFSYRMRGDNPDGSGIGKEDNLLGGLYIEPYYSGGNISADFIPFEFNPIINDGGLQAKYQTEELLGRLLSVRSYISTDSNSVTIDTKYLATSSPADNKRLGNDPFEWQENWTPEVLREIEKKYRKLVYPFISGNIFVRPPIVRIKLGYGRVGGESHSNRVSTLFSYPNTDGALEVTMNLEDATKEKRYIVTNVSINPISQDDFANAYFIEPTGKSSGAVSYRRGFSVNLTLMETTKNFLDTVPNYYHYDKNDR